MRNQQQGFWGSGGFAGIGGALLILSSSLKKDPIITDHCAASQACSIGEDHLTGDELDCVFTAGAIRSRLSKAKPTLCSGYLKDIDKTRDGSDQAA